MPRNIRTVRTILLCASCMLWSIGIAGDWVRLLRRVDSLSLAAGSTATVCAVLCWLAISLRDRAMIYLIDAVVASRRAAAGRPLRAVPPR